MTLSRIQALESLRFEWRLVSVTPWEDQLSKLAEYRKIYGHCNVSRSDYENTKLARWVERQRGAYRLHLEGKPSPMTKTRIQTLESLGLEWEPSISHTQGVLKEPSLDDNAARVRERAKESPEHIQKVPAVNKSAVIKSKSTLTSSRDECQQHRRVEAGHARFDETDLDGSHSELSAQSSLHSNSQATKWLLLDKSALTGESVESYPRKDALQANQQKSINSFPHALLVAGPPENKSLVAATKPPNLRQDEESQLEMLWANPLVSEPLQRSHNVFTHALLLGDGSTVNGVRANPDKSQIAQEDMQQMPQDKVFQSDNVLNEVELELIWLGEESMYCLSCPEFQFDFIYEYASPALKVELRKLSRDDQSETEKVKQIVRMDEWLVSRRFDFVRNYLRNMLRRGFRRQRMGTVIAELRLMRRQQSMRHFPAMIFDMSETAPVNASANAIEQVDANTLKVVATFLSQSEAERQTGIPRTNIRRGLRQGRPQEGYFWRSARL
jgi:hypothetical protein